MNNFNIVGHDDIIETYKLLNHDGYLYGYQFFVNVFLLNLRDKCYNEGVESLNETEKYIMGLVETSWTRAKELKRGSEILMDYYRELETVEYIDLPDPIDKVAEEIEIEKSIAREDGFEEGLRDGLKKGEKVGRKAGKIDAYQTIVKNLHSNGMTLETIANHLKISIGETEKLLNDVNIFV